MPLTSEIGSLLRRVREDAGLTRSELSRRLGITLTQVSRIESGERQPPLDTLEAWANACDRSVLLAFRRPDAMPAGEHEALVQDIMNMLGALTRSEVEVVHKCVESMPESSAEEREELLAHLRNIQNANALACKQRMDLITGIDDIDEALARAENAMAADEVALARLRVDAEATSGSARRGIELAMESVLGSLRESAEYIELLKRFRRPKALQEIEVAVREADQATHAAAEALAAAEHELRLFASTESTMPQLEWSDELQRLNGRYREALAAWEAAEQRLWRLQQEKKDAAEAPQPPARSGLP
jgi:transcriptional regulator with XRE-family HTH domain